MSAKTVKDIEYSRWSQNGEDGVINHIIEKVGAGNKTFLEIGSGNGKENNTTNLVYEGWSGVVVDRKEQRIQEYRARKFKRVTAMSLEVDPRNIGDVLSKLNCQPDVFSLDIDSIDYWVMQALLCKGFKPRVAVLEYNASFLFDRVSVPVKMKERAKDLYFGAGIEAWNSLMTRFGYKFITVESSGTNAFYSLEGEFEFLPLNWIDSDYQFRRFGALTKRRDALSIMPLENV